MEQQLAREFLSRLDELGVALDSPQLEALDAGSVQKGFLIHRLTKGPVSLIYAPSVTAGTVSLAAQHPHPLVLAHRIAPGPMNALRESRVDYLDRAGNARIERGGVLIDVRGRRPASPEPPGEGIRSANLFSIKRSQVVMVLLAWPRLAKAPIRVLAEAAGVSVGQAHETSAVLADYGYFDLESRRILQGRLLLDSWAAAYPTGLGARGRFLDFRGDVLRPLESDDVVYVSGESAVPDHLRGIQNVTVYTTGDRTRLALANRWVKSGERNVHVGPVFWREPSAEPRSRAVLPAPTPLIYADLLASGDPRQREVAAEIREAASELRGL